MDGTERPAIDWGNGNEARREEERKEREGERERERERERAEVLRASNFVLARSLPKRGRGKLSQKVPGGNKLLYRAALSLSLSPSLHFLFIKIPPAYEEITAY